MRIQVNLATRPFVELRPFFLRLRIIMAALALVAVGLLVGIHIYQQRLDRAQAQMDQLQSRIDAARREKQSNERRMRQPVNAAVLDRAHFLNGLFLRKSFSWTAVMMDLETVLPIGVQVTSIEPQISVDGDVAIRLRVSGERDRAVQLVRNLERSKRFLAPRLTAEAVQAKEAGQGSNAANIGPTAAPGGVEFEIMATYNPLPEGETYTKAKAEGGGAVSHPRAAPVAGRPGSSQGYGIVLKPYAGKPKGGIQ